MPRAPHLIRGDLAKATDLARRAIGLMNRKQFFANDIHFAAAERALEIISEASRHLPTAALAQHSLVPWPSVRAMGNRLRHEYWATDPDHIWSTITLDLELIDDLLRDSSWTPTP
jgi:uncharacterized protein with HEPN domain